MLRYASGNYLWRQRIKTKINNWKQAKSTNKVQWKRKPKIKEIEIEVEKIVEVIKEVPVTKVVTQEVPKEVIRKQIVHVPIASDDLTILDFNEKLSNQSKKDNKDTDDKDTSNSKT